MDTGKILSINGGVLVLVSTFLLAWFTVGAQYAYGVNLIMNITTMFTPAGALALSLSWGVPIFVSYIVGGFYILFLISGILILIGVKIRALAIIGAIMPLLLCYAIIAGSLSVPPDFYPYISVFLGDALVDGIIPFNLGIGPSTTTALGPVIVSLGTYILLAGGVVGLVGGIMGRSL